MPQTFTYTPLVVAGETRETVYRERTPGSPDYAFPSRDQSQAKSTRKYNIPWHDDPGVIWQALKDFLGYSVMTNVAGFKEISRTVPASHPSFPGFFYADGVTRVEGDVPEGKDENGVGTFDEAIVTVQYGKPNYKILSDDELRAASGTSKLEEWRLLRYVSADYQTVGRYQSVPAGRLRWKDNSRTMQRGEAFLLCEADLTVTWWEVPIAAVPLTAIFNTVGKTNAEEFGSAGTLICGKIDPRKMVCQFPKITIVGQPDGTHAANIAYKWRIYPFGANFFYRDGPGPAGFFEAEFIDGTPVFPEADYRDLFKPE